MFNKILENFTIQKFYPLIIFNQSVSHFNDSLTTEKHYFTEQTDNVVSKINLTLMCFGIVGNLMCIWVLAHKKLYQKRFNRYLLMLAFVELFFCIIAFANYLTLNLNAEPNQRKEQRRGRRALYDLSVFTCYFTGFFVNILDESSVYFVLLMSIDRLQAIRCPIKIKLFITQQKQLFLVVGGISLIAFLNMPYFLFHQHTFKGRVALKFVEIRHKSNFSSRGFILFGTL